MTWLRTVLALIRPSRLPTFWSNCLAGWWLGAAGNFSSLPLLFAGTTCLFVGGGFLNDAFDADFDREHHPLRPIPAGTLRHETVWRWGLGWLVAGTLLLAWLGRTSAMLGLTLVFLIILYNTVHRLSAFAPAFKGLCRFALYLIGACVAERGVTGWALWCGLALAVYTAGVGFFERWKTRPTEARFWPAALLLVPIGLALLMNAGPTRESALLLSAALALWALRALRFTFWSPSRDLHVTANHLLAGIVFVDWLAAADAPRELSFVFLGLLGLTLLLQRFLPAD